VCFLDADIRLERRTPSNYTRWCSRGATR
jgi:hypothetical protein